MSFNVSPQMNYSAAMTTQTDSKQMLPVSVTSNSSDAACVPVPNLYTISFQIIVFPSLVINLILFAAAVLDRKKLQRQNFLFASVISTLLSNVLYLVMLEWTLIDNYFEKTIYQKQAGILSFSKYVWVFQEAATVSVPFLICGNIVSLTYVTVNSATYVGRVAHVDDTEHANRRSKKIKNVTLALIGTSWTVPLVLTIVAMADMNCVIDCICPSTNFRGTICPNQTHCSNFWAPVTKAYLWINVGMWFVVIIGLCSLVTSAIRKYRHTIMEPKCSLEMTNSQTNNDIIIVEPVGLDVTAANTNATESSSQRIARPPLTRKQTKRSFMQRLNSRLRFALIQTFVYVFCSACFIAAISIDSISSNQSEYLAFGLARITMYLYTTICPIVMIHHLPVLKTSLSKLWHLCKACCKRKSPNTRELS